MPDPEDKAEGNQPKAPRVSREDDSAPLRAAENFITKRSKRPLWVFGWGLVLMSVTTIFGVVVDLNEQNAHIAKFNSLAHTYEGDGRRTAIITQTMGLVLDASIEALGFFVENISTKRQDLASISPDVLQKQLQLIVTARRGANAELSVLSSVQFNDSSFTPFVGGFQSDMEALDEILAEKEAICQKLLDKKYDEAKAALEKLRQFDYKKERQLNAASIRMSSLENTVRLKEEAYAAELQLQQARLRTFKLRYYLVLPLSGIVGLFAVIAIGSYRKAAREERKRAGGRRD